MLKITTPTAADKVVMRYVVHEHIQTKEPNKIKKRKLTASNGGGLCAAFSRPNPFEIELASESGTDESVQGTEVTGTQWILDSGVSSWCTLPASFEFCNEFGLESVESFRRESASLLTVVLKVRVAQHLLTLLLNDHIRLLSLMTLASIEVDLPRPRLELVHFHLSQSIRITTQALGTGRHDKPHYYSHENPLLRLLHSPNPTPMHAATTAAA
jgi:hypothetical protein